MPHYAFEPLGATMPLCVIADARQIEELKQLGYEFHGRGPDAVFPIVGVRVRIGDRIVDMDCGPVHWEPTPRR